MSGFFPPRPKRRALADRTRRAGGRVVCALLAAAGCGFIARDLLGLGGLSVAVAWGVGVLIAVLPEPDDSPGGPRKQGEPAGPRSGPPGSSLGDESGQATVEWVGMVLAASLAFGGLAAVGPPIDGRSLGGFLGHRIVCAVKAGCRDDDRALVDAYGERDAALVRAAAPNLVYEPGERQLPVDYRRCRSPDCASAPDDPDEDVHRSDARKRATVFTHVIRRDGRIYAQYWLYYPESNTAWAASDKIWERSILLPLVGQLVNGSTDYPGKHRDDWESVHVRIDPSGEVWMRVSSHGHFQGCKFSACTNQWFRTSGWSRVSRGSHAGHIPAEYLTHGLPLRGSLAPPPRFRALLPGRDLHERTTTAEGLRLVPLETRDKRGYRRLDGGVEPPWDKAVYTDPESDSS